MAKYNITPKKEKNARYQTLLSEETKDRLKDEILRIVVTEGKYKDKDYNRVNDAMSLLTDKRYLKMTIEDIAEMAGFSTRQSFYSNFYKRLGVTPRQYRQDHLAK